MGVGGHVRRGQGHTPEGARMTAPSRFLDDLALKDALAPHMKLATFTRALAELERRGFPKRDPLFRGRYWPAVSAWLDERAGMRVNGARLDPFAWQAPDGMETWDDEKPDARPDRPPAKERPRSSVLERREPLDQAAGLPRPLDPFTERRHGSRDHRPLRDL